MNRYNIYCYVFYFIFVTINCQEYVNHRIQNSDTVLNVVQSESGIKISLSYNGTVKLQGEIGIGVSSLVKCVNVENCYENDKVRLHITNEIDQGITVFWTTKDLSLKFEDCFELENYNWYGGPELKTYRWPIEKNVLDNFANILQEKDSAAVVEPYWLNSQGAYIFVDQRVPLFINQNTATSQNKVCFSAEQTAPYHLRKKVVLQYSLVAVRNVKDAHLHAVENFLGKPTGYPNYHIISRPIWSTWAKYKRDVSDAVLLEFLQEIVENGYEYGQYEIDDDWEECYGALTFSEKKFKDITNTVKEIKKHNFTVTLWVHPFVNVNCKKYVDIGRRYGYFVNNSEGDDRTQWWNSGTGEALHLDFTNPEVRNWFRHRLRNLQLQHGIDSFKFDAGEVTWVPQLPVLNGDVDALPNSLSTDYVRTCATFGDLVEVRSAWNSQDLPIFVRMIDKDSIWNETNGLSTLVTTLLQMNMNGYTLVLPDMVGGNGYNEKPDAELFVRWLQANVFMPSIQFSYVPWQFNSTEINVKGISKKMIDLHEKFSPLIVTQMKRSVKEGHPVNAPIWWIDPSNDEALKEDTEFLLGDDLLAAPVLEQGATSRTIYLPRGIWVDGNRGNVYEGPRAIYNYTAPIEVLPYFVREGSEAHKIQDSSFFNSS